MTDPPVSLVAFLEAAPDEAAQALYALSAAVSLTDGVAGRLLEECKPFKFEPELFIRLLHECDFVVERNSEYHFEPAARSFLLNELLRQQPERHRKMHSILYSLAQTADPAMAGDTIPNYLTSKVGLAYHSVAIGSPQGLELYRKAFTREQIGEQWLLGVLAKEQQQNRLLPPQAIEPYFFEGMTAYHEERWDAAEENFAHIAKVATDEDTRVEVAISLHLLGRILHQQNKDNEALAVLRRSLSILDRMGDLRGQAQVLNSMAMAIANENPKESEQLLRRSLMIGQKIGDEQHQAQVEHSLGNLVGGNTDRVPEAIALLRHSLSLREKHGDLRGQAQVLQSLAKLIRGRSPSEAEKYLRRSLRIDRQRGNLNGQAQVLNSLAVLIQWKKPNEAIEMLRESIKINERKKNFEGKVKCLNSLGQVLLNLGKWKEARECYLAVTKTSKQAHSLAIAYLGLANIASKYEKDSSRAREYRDNAAKFMSGRRKTGLLGKVRKRLRRFTGRPKAK